MSTFLLFTYNFMLMPFYSGSSESCLVKNETQATIRYVFQNCSESFHCCFNECCSNSQFTVAVAVYSVVGFICCASCIKVCWDVCRGRLNCRFNNTNTSATPATRTRQILPSPPPVYDVAIFLPQPQDRIPSYGEAVSEESVV